MNIYTEAATLNGICKIIHFELKPRAINEMSMLDDPTIISKQTNLKSVLDL